MSRKKEDKKSGLYTFTEFVGDSLIPKKFRKDIIRFLEKASIKEVPYYQYGVAAYIILAISLVLDVLIVTHDTFANVPFFVKIPLAAIFLFPIFFLFSSVAVSFYYSLLRARISAKVRQMEDVFPEFLEELSLNLKAGQSLEMALSNSTEAEFGHLTEEIHLICEKVSLGIDLEVAIREFVDDYHSDLIKETFDLILVGWRKGTRITKIVDRFYENMMLTRHLRNKVIASVSNYRIFLTFVTVLISPAMFALSYHLIVLVRNITSKILAVSGNVNLPITLQAVRVNDNHFIIFSYLALVLISISTSMIISIIKTGSIEEGYKQIVVISALTILSYTFFFFVFGNFFTMFAT